jgi:flagellar basal body-associated protein FliL
MTPNEGSSEKEMDDGTLTMILIAVNGSIVLIGVIAAAVIIFMRKKPTSSTSSPEPAKQSSATTDADLSMEEAPKGIKKLLGMFKKRSKAEKS